MRWSYFVKGEHRHHYDRLLRVVLDYHRCAPRNTFLLALEDEGERTPYPYLGVPRMSTLTAWWSWTKQAKDGSPALLSAWSRDIQAHGGQHMLAYDPRNAVGLAINVHNWKGDPEKERKRFREEGRGWIEVTLDL